MRKLRHSLVALVVAGVLTACGGGGGGGGGNPSGGGGPNPPPPPPPPPTEPANTAPTVEAGEAKTIELPVNTVDLQGSAQDSQQTTLTYSWTSSPADGVTFENAAAAATKAQFTTAGTYTLTLSASDGSLSATDTVEIVVSAATYPAADTDADDNHGWVRVTPAEAGMDATLLTQASDYALTGGGSGVISRRGRIVHSWGDIDARVDLKSTTKSVGGIALGLAIDDGMLTLNDAAQTHLPTIGAAPISDPDSATNIASGWLDDITIRQLATHTAGFDKPGNYSPLIYQPGSTWAYSDDSLNWLADVLTTKYAGDLNGVLNTRVWSVIGITNDDLRWREGSSLRPFMQADGLPHRELASGISANANALARVGLLFLRKGVWANDQRVLSESFVTTVATPQPEIASAQIANSTDFPSATTNYGVLWWTNATGMLPEVPRDAFWGWGKGDSLLVVIPSLDLVIARLGNDPDVADPSQPLPPLWRADWNGDYQVLEPFITPIAKSVAP